MTPGRKPRVLVIDDDAVAQTAIANLLTAGGFDVHILDSPIGATRAIRDQRIDIVVCDLNMPAMRGDAFARMFRKTSLFSKIPLVVLSAAPQKELDAIRAQGMADAVVHKGELRTGLLPILRKLVTPETS